MASLPVMYYDHCYTMNLPTPTTESYLYTHLYLERYRRQIGHPPVIATSSKQSMEAKHVKTNS